MLEADADRICIRWRSAGRSSITGGLLRLVIAAGVEPAEQAADLLSDLIEGALLNQLSLPRPDFDGRLRAALTRALAVSPLHRPLKVVAGGGSPCW